MTRRSAALLAATLTVATLAAVPSLTTPSPVAAAVAAPARVSVTKDCIDSVPEPGESAPVKICYSIYKPGPASPKRPVPMIMHSHGWAGERATKKEISAFTAAGYGVLSFDQRGFGISEGFAHVENPDFEGVDVRKLVVLISKLPWVQQDGPGDPRLGAVGGSYGGGYQFLGAFEELRLQGKPIFDALAPQITWNDLEGSLAPEGVVRTEWALALSAAALPSNALPPYIYKGLVEGAVQGTFPDGAEPGTENLSAFFEKNGPAYHVKNGRKLDIPVLFGQGTTDGLFPLEQGLTNWRTAITPRARKQSIFVGYNGGHVLPAVFPQGVNVTSDPCSKALGSKDFEQLSIRFFDEVLRGRDRNLTGFNRIHLATAGSDCISVKSVKAAQKVDLGSVGNLTAVSAPIPVEIAAGPITVAGTPYLTGAVTALGVQNRMFLGLGVGASPLDARLVQNNVLPLSEPMPVSGAARRVDLPSVAVKVPKGQFLYLIVSPISDTFVGMGSRTPGAILIDNTVVHLPVVRR
ncbi:MAG: CocE/NonD family hydrolase [Nocardioides sp.]